MTERHVVGRAAGDLVGDDGDHSEAAIAASTYEGGNEQVRTTLMNHFGYFETESSHHASEYLPYFRKDPQLVEAYLPERWDYYEICTVTRRSGRHRHPAREAAPADLRPSVEYGAGIVNAVVSGTPTVVYGNVPNSTGLITNLPPRPVSRCPAWSTTTASNRPAVGALPLQLAALNRTNIGVQTLAVQAALTGDRENVYHAVAVDPLTAAICTLEQARSMTDELFEAHDSLLPAGLRA